jgi:N utilization substance protein B
MSGDSAGPRASSPPHASRFNQGAKSLARKLAMQALYRLQLNDAPWQDLISEFATEEGMDRADDGYFRELVQGIHTARSELDAELAGLTDRSPTLLDPIEHAVLLIGMYELKSRPEVPYRVVINEGVSLAKRFGATDGHKFVNAVLDRAARTLRPHEH